MSSIIIAKAPCSHFLELAGLNIKVKEVIIGYFLFYLGIMEFVQIKDITTQKEGESINLRASLQFRTELTKWERKASKTTMRSPGGFKITGILVDSTSSIDFVSWTNKFDDILKTDETFELSHVKVSLIKREYARTEHECQLVLEDSSSITPLNIEPFVPPLNVAPIAELNTYSSGSSVSVVGKVLHISAPGPFYSQQIVKARLRDNTGVIQYSLIGNAIKKLQLRR